MHRCQGHGASHAASSSTARHGEQQISLLMLITVKFWRDMFLPFIDFVAFPAEMFALSCVCSALRNPVIMLYIYQTRAVHRMRQRELFHMYAWLTHILHQPLELGGSIFHFRVAQEWNDHDTALFFSRLQLIARVLIHYFPSLVDPNIREWRLISAENRFISRDRRNIPAQYQDNRSFYLRALSFLFSEEIIPRPGITWYVHTLRQQRLELELAMRACFGSNRLGTYWRVPDLWRSNDHLSNFVPYPDHRVAVHSRDFVDYVNNEGVSFTEYELITRVQQAFPWLDCGPERAMTIFHYGFHYPF